MIVKSDRGQVLPMFDHPTFVNVRSAKLSRASPEQIHNFAPVGASHQSQKSNIFITYLKS